MLSSDPSDILKSQKHMPMAQDDAQPFEQVIVVRDEEGNETTFKNPVRSQGFNPISFVLGSIISFWLFIVMKFWYAIPAMVAILYVTVSPETIASIAEAGVTMGAMFSSLFWHMVWASGASIISAWIIGKRLQHGIPTTRGNMTLLQLPALFLAGLAFYDVALMIFLSFKGIF